MNNIKILEANNLTLMSDCLNIRKKVFIEEQGVPEEIELDELDKSSFQITRLALKSFLSLLPC